MCDAVCFLTREFKHCSLNRGVRAVKGWENIRWRRDMKDFLESIAKRLVDHPDQVSIEMDEKEGKVIFRLNVNEQDVGKVIGKKGRTAQAMRTLLAAVAAKEGKRAILEIND